MHSNKDSDPEKYVLKLKVHRGGVKKCQYSKDGLKVISCSNDSGVKVNNVLLLNTNKCAVEVQISQCYAAHFRWQV